ncbi:MAG TPA: hypothetical protein VKP88_02115 [Candidatus Paceibacterota bacterium]|nr:hypothetical protein [Candidatus Paceibacterota bacterium]
MSKIIEHPIRSQRSNNTIYQPNIFVDCDDVALVYEIADFLALVHEQSLKPIPARYGGYWLRFKKPVEVYPSSLKVVGWLYQTSVSQPHLQ